MPILLSVVGIQSHNFANYDGLGKINNFITSCDQNRCGYS